MLSSSPGAALFKHFRYSVALIVTGVQNCESATYFPDTCALTGTVKNTTCIFMVLFCGTEEKHFLTKRCSCTCHEFFSRMGGFCFWEKLRKMSAFVTHTFYLTHSQVVIFAHGSKNWVKNCTRDHHRMKNIVFIAAGLLIDQSWAITC